MLTAPALKTGRCTLFFRYWSPPITGAAFSDLSRARGDCAPKDLLCARHRRRGRFTGARRALRRAEGPLTNICIKYFKHFGPPP